MKYVAFHLSMLLVCIATISHSQQTADSLLKVWNTSTFPDSVRLKAFDRLITTSFLYSQPDSAFILAEIEMKFADAHGLPLYQAKATVNMGNALSIQGRQKEAIPIYEQSIQLARKALSRLDESRAISNLGTAYATLGDFDAALKCHLQSIEIDKISNNKRGVGSSLGSIGNIHRDQASYEMALLYYNEALLLFEETKNLRGEAAVFLNLGVVNEQLGNYPEAIKQYTRSLDLFRSMNILDGVSTALNNLGSVYFYLGDLVTAEKFYCEGLPISEKMNRIQVSSRIHANLATIQIKRGDYAASLDNLLMALELLRPTGDHLAISSVMNEIGNVYCRIKKSGVAIAYLDSSLTLAIEQNNKLGIAGVLNDICAYHHSEGNYQRALEYAIRSRAVASEIKALETLRNVDRNLFYLHLKCDSIDAAKVDIESLTNQELRDIDLNFGVITELQREFLFDQFKGDFDSYFSFTFDHLSNRSNDLIKAFNLALFLKGILLKNSTATRQIIYESQDSLLISQYQNWTSIKRRIVRAIALGSDTEELETEASILENELVRKSQDFASLKRFQELGWKDVQLGLDKGECAIEFIHFAVSMDYQVDSVKDKFYCALLVKHDSEHPEMIRLFEESELEKIIGNFPGNNLSYIHQVYGKKENTKSQLYDLIWKPMEKSLEGVKKVYVSPVGLLHKISFSALAKEQDVFLCDVHEIEMQSSTGNIAVISATPDQPGNMELEEIRKQRITLFGGIDYNSDSSYNVIWNYLDGSMTETEKIEKILRKDGQNISYYNLSSATEEQFKKTASESNILHIATHGFFYADPDEVIAQEKDESESNADLSFRGGTSGIDSYRYGVQSFVKSRNPLMRSGLVFAGANDVWNRSASVDDPIAIGIENYDSTYKEDGVLTAAEVANIDMRKTELVVLSACETGLGDIKGSEGVYGLQRAFKMAGVKYIIMSLWQVPDKETAEFMTLFYKNLTKVSDIRKSFNLTQRTMREKYDPYYWGAFVLIE